MTTALLPYPGQDRLFGCLLGGCIGAALGAPVEGLSLARIRERYGAAGLTDLDRDSAAGGETQLMLLTAEAAFELGRKSAALTHGHPSGFLPGGVLAATVWGLVSGLGFEESLDLAREQLTKHAEHRETAQALDAAVRLAKEDGPSTPERVESLGRGHTAPEALAIGVYVALRAEDDTPATEWNVRKRPALVGQNALLRAVNHSGDSDATGIVAGNLIGARYGGTAFPGNWQLDAGGRGQVNALAADLALEFGPAPPTGGYGEPPLEWQTRYWTY